MRKYLLIALVLFTVFNLNAQVPGYMGKKLSIGYDFNFYIGGIQPDSRTFDTNYQIYQPSIFLDKFSEFHADYVLSNNYSLGTSYEFLKTGQFYSEGESGFYYGNYDANNYLNIAASTFEINNKFFFYNSGHALAPVGNYGLISVGFVNAHATAKVKGTLNTDSGLIYISKIVQHESVTTPIISAGLGNQFVLFDRIIIDAGVELAFLPVAVKAFQSYYQSDYTAIYPNKKLAQNEILKRLQTFYVSSVKVGVGILLF